MRESEKESEREMFFRRKYQSLQPPGREKTTFYDTKKTSCHSHRDAAVIKAGEGKRGKEGMREKEREKKRENMLGQNVIKLQEMTFTCDKGETKKLLSCKEKRVSRSSLAILFFSRSLPKLKCGQFYLSLSLSLSLSIQNIAYTYHSQPLNYVATGF